MREREQTSEEQKTGLKKSYFLIFQLQKKQPQSQGRGQCTERYNKICLLSIWWKKVKKK